MITPSQAEEIAILETIWATSQDLDDRAFRPPQGWWLLSSWATASQLLIKDGQPIGVVAIETTPTKKSAEARLALLPAFRDATSALLLVDQALILAHQAGATYLRLSIPSEATWAREAAQQRNFSPQRTRQVMLHPPLTKPLPLRQMETVQIRRLYEGEEQSVLDALNRA